MKKKLNPMIVLYLGLFLMICSVVITVNTLNAINDREIETLASAKVRVQLDFLESQIKEMVFNKDERREIDKSEIPSENIQNIDNQLARFEAQLEPDDKKLEVLKSIKEKWEILKKELAPDRLDLLYEVDILHRTIDMIALQDIANRQKVGKEDIAFLIKLGIATGVLAFLLIVVAIYFEIRETKLKDELVKASQEAEKKAVESSKAKTMFLAIVGHELRTPLNGIIGLSELLRKTNLPAKEIHFIDNIYHSGKALLKIINNILEFAKIESGKIELENADFSLTTVVHQIITSLSVKAHEKNINLNYIIDKNVPKRLFGDASRLSQIIYNLVGNAVKFTAVGTVTLKIKVHSIDSVGGIRLHFSVEDTGIGISPEQQKKLFIPFNAIQPRAMTGEMGSGLGLAISMQIAKAMGGEIDVVSEVGKGSCFSFTVTFSRFSEERIGTIEQQQLQFPDEHKEIKPIFSKDAQPLVLVVDDNPTNLLMAQAMLERLGTKTVTATNGKEAIYEYSNGKIDLILMDCQMPIMDGFEATRELRKLLATVPIIAMTANTAYEDQAKCFDVGMNGFIPKPISINLLADSLLKFIGPDVDAVSVETLKTLSSSIGTQGMAKVVQSFLNELPKAEESLDQLVEQKDLVGIRKIGHRNKSSSLTVGAKKLADLFLQLEQTEQVETAAELKQKIKIAANTAKAKLIEHLTHIQ